MSIEVIGRLLILLGLLTIAIGGLVLLAPHLPFLGKLPGDLSFQRRGISVHIPLATSIIVSIVLTIILNVVLRLWK